MSDDLLFPAEQVSMLSPRLSWVKKHSVRTHYSTAVDDGEPRWCAWLPSDEQELGGIPTDPEACGYGNTEEEALRDLAVTRNIPLWNEE